ncbi:MAG: hypothetical protein SNF33_00090 (plasmid) [Candidatus Algichlamydia australiensis]|nr:hypothetical protein [Chlamydiales bacterium]
MKKSIIVSLLAFSCSFTFSGEPKKIDLSQPLRIKDFIPDDALAATLAVDPALPENFIARSPNTDEKDYLMGVYWGSEKAINEYFKDPNTLSEPIIRARLSLNVAQDNPAGFDEEKLKKEVKTDYPKGTLHKLGNWGNYQYSLISTVMEGRKLDLGWVCLNDESRAVLFLQLIRPEKGIYSDEKAKKLWNTFFEETTELPNPLFAKAYGYELYKGYSILSVSGYRYKIAAQKRRRDGKVLFCITPLSESLRFNYENAEFVTGDEDDWLKGELLLVVSGAVEINNKKLNLTSFRSDGVRLEEVEEFTLTKPEGEGVVFKEVALSEEDVQKPISTS